MVQKYIKCSGESGGGSECHKRYKSCITNPNDQMGKVLFEPLPRRTAVSLENTHWLLCPDIGSVGCYVQLPKAKQLDGL